MVTATSVGDGHVHLMAAREVGAEYILGAEAGFSVRVSGNGWFGAMGDRGRAARCGFMSWGLFTRVIAIVHAAASVRRSRKHLGRGMSLLSIHIRDEMRHGVSDTRESLPAAVPRVDPQDRLQNGLSCACFIDSGHFHGMLMQLVPS